MDKSIYLYLACLFVCWLVDFYQNSWTNIFLNFMEGKCPKKCLFFIFYSSINAIRKINEIFGFIYMCGEKMEFEKATFESQIVIRKMGLKHTKKT